MSYLFARRSRTPCSRQVDHKLLCIPKYSRVKCEAICPTAKAWMKVGHATGAANLKLND